MATHPADPGNAKLGQAGADESGGCRLLQGQLGMGVQMPAPSGKRFGKGIVHTHQLPIGCGKKPDLPGK